MIEGEGEGACRDDSARALHFAGVLYLFIDFYVCVRVCAIPPAPMAVATRDGEDLSLEPHRSQTSLLKSRGHPSPEPRPSVWGPQIRGRPVLLPWMFRFGSSESQCLHPASGGEYRRREERCQLTRD